MIKRKEGGCSRADMDISQETEMLHMSVGSILPVFFSRKHRQHFKSTDHFNKLERRLNEPCLPHLKQAYQISSPALAVGTVANSTMLTIGSYLLL